jgi:nucleoside-diphosphate kinase
MIKPHAYNNFGKIIDAIYQNGFEINKLKMSKFNNNSAAGFYAEHVGKGFYPNLSALMTSDVCVGLELVANDAVAKWREVIGPTNSTVAKSQAPNSIRAKFGVD